MKRLVLVLLLVVGCSGSSDGGCDASVCQLRVGCPCAPPVAFACPGNASTLTCSEPQKQLLRCDGATGMWALSESCARGCSNNAGAPMCL